MLLSLSFQSNPSLNRVESLHNFYCWKADMLLKVLVVNCEAVSCAAVLFMQCAIRFPFQPLRVSTYQATWFVSFNSQYWWQRRCLTQMWLRKEMSSRKLVATIGKKCHGCQTKKKKEISVFFVDSSYFPLTPERVEELSRSFMMVNLLLELVSKTRWNKTVSMSPQNSKPRSSCLLTSTVLSLVVCVAILSCLLLWGRLGLFRLRRLSLTNPSRVNTWVAKISLWVLQGFSLRIKWVQ